MNEIDLFSKFSSNKNKLQDEVCLDFHAIAVPSQNVKNEIYKRIKGIENEREFMNSSKDIERPFEEYSEERSCLLAPWVQECSAENMWANLHHEIISFVDYIRPTKSEVLMRTFVVRTISDICKDIWPDCTIETFGSMKTELLLPKSDIDISVFNVPCDLVVMDLLAKEIENRGLAEGGNTRIIDSAKVPIVKFIFKGTVVNVDICFNSKDGLRTTKKLNDLLDRYPVAYPLIMVVKMFLYIRKLHEPFHGGLGSYATALLVLNFLQNHPYRDLPDMLRQKVSVGMLLVEFFRVVGFYFNFPFVGISLTDGGSYFKKLDRESRGILIADPVNYDNNAASAARHFPSIIKAFQNAYFTLRMSNKAELKKIPEVFFGYTRDRVDSTHNLLARIIWISQEEHEMRERISHNFT